MKNEFKKITSILLLTASASVLLSGCESTLAVFKKEKVQISIGDWLLESEMARIQKEEFEKANPDIEIIPETYVFQVDNFEQKADNSQLPNLYRAYFTEAQRVIEKGYAMDMTDALAETGWKQYMNPELKTLLSDDEGRIYGIPYEVYAQGLCINKRVFREAGLVDEQSNIRYPKTLEEMAEFAQIIHERTGKVGFVLPTTNNCGGWHFMNIAWNYGSNFMQQIDGRYQATFNTQETKAALEYVRDLKWKYNALPKQTEINLEEMNKMFSTGKVGMMFSPPGTFIAQQYGMSKDDQMMVGVPAGPQGSFSQMGGTAYMISAHTTPEQIRAILKWLDFIGKGPDTNERQLQWLEQDYQTRRDNGKIILNKVTFNIWLKEEENVKRQMLRTKYCNVNGKDYENYFNFSGIQIKPEEPIYCQDLYAILDKCIQAILTDKNADIDQLMADANHKFQIEYLDKLRD